MRERWVKGNVDVSALKDKIIAFFKEREFSISVKEDDGEFLIIASPHKVHKIAEKIVVKISGNSNDFSVEFVAGKHSSDLVKLGSLLTIIGGGFLAKKGLNSLEKLEALEKDFWVFTRKVVGELSK